MVQTRRVLLVDDDASMRFVLSRALQELGLVVEVLEDGSEVPEAVSSRRFDLIIADLYMAGMNGFEVLRRLRRPESIREQHGPTNSTVPILIVSGESDPASVANARARGADAYLTKPVDLDEFQVTVRRLLGE